ncbi:hypothetical protein CEXT_137611 [Caerostris extrusa]|uniref:Uncharacterized protein n=1 Tax=Caerostris extrusa TaxID=172846 RepID=A0AAV4Y7I7_CAEEX|nr:hypothetical protein CEXT_137611 [Caerostris extrusa]
MRCSMQDTCVETPSVTMPREKKSSFLSVFISSAPVLPRLAQNTCTISPPKAQRDIHLKAVRGRTLING